MSPPSQDTNEWVYFVSRNVPAVEIEAKPSANKSAAKRKAHAEVFLQGGQPVLGVLEGGPAQGGFVQRKFAEVSDDWQRVIGQVGTLITNTSAVPVSGFRFDEVSVGLAFDAKGKLGFIAEAGLNASITFVFKRV